MRVSMREAVVELTARFHANELEIWLFKIVVLMLA